jgi:uncharacterized membrane protein (UPF0127 family)
MNSKSRISTPSGDVLKAEVLRDRMGRALGLSYRKKLSVDAALFVFLRPGKYFFHMYGMKFPIDIVFLDSKGEVVFMVYNQTPSTRQFPKPLISSPIPCQYVIEMPAMSASRYGLALGSRVNIDGILGRV